MICVPEFIVTSTNCEFYCLLVFVNWCNPNRYVYSVYFSTVSTAVICMISGFLRYVDENCTRLGYYAVSGGNFLPTFWDNLSVPSSGFKNLKENLWPQYGVIEGWVWTVQSLSKMVSANRVVASVWDGGKCGSAPWTDMLHDCGSLARQTL